MNENIREYLTVEGPSKMNSYVVLIACCNTHDLKLAYTLKCILSIRMSEALHGF